MDMFLHNRVGDGVLDVPKHPENRVGADANVRPLKNHTGYCSVILSE